MRLVHVSPIFLLPVALGIGCSSGSAEVASSLGERDLGSVASLVACPSDNSSSKCPAGSYAVTCANGSTEVDTKEQVSSNQVCVPPPPPPGVASLVACPSGSTSATCPAGEFLVTCSNGSTEVDTEQKVLANQACMAPPPACVPTTCTAQSRTCGSIPDGCGGTLSCGDCSYLVGGPSVGPMYVDDDVVVTVNGKQVYSDLGHGAANRNPIALSVAPGDAVTMSFFDTFGGALGHSDMWLSGPGVPAQKVESGLNGAGSSYPADTVQPFDIVVFQVPGPGQTATLGCLPEVSLNTSYWHKSTNLVIRQATTKAYNLTWTVNSHDYNYTPDCNGWVSDVFIAADGSWATVRWNTITHQLQTSAVSGHAYSTAIAQAAAQWAVNTTFPGGDLGLLTIN